MATKTLNNVRLSLKHDTYENWLKATNFTPNKGEPIVYDKDSTCDYQRLKIGDGETNVNDLPFINVQPDWNQNNESDADYVKNRPFYEIEPSYTFTFDGNTSGMDYYNLAQIGYPGLTAVKISDKMLTADQIEYGYIELSNDLKYILSSKSAGVIDNEESYPGIIIYGLIMVVNTNSTNVFYKGTYFIINDAGVYPVKFESSPLVKAIDKKFIPYLAGIEVTKTGYEVDGEILVAQFGAEVFNDYDNNKAIGEYSHAEGCSNIALGNYSHAQGYETTASGNASHSQGYGTTASGESSHAEGDYTVASGSATHAEGYHTIASGQYQHVEGKFNVEDTDNKYAHIIGNGTEETRSNAHTVDWEGNAWYAGKVYVGGTSQDDAVELKNIIVDDTLSDTSTNPVQNKIITAKVNEITTSLETHTSDSNIHVTSEEKALIAEIENLKNKPVIQSDWNQNDESAADYVKNRPFYEIQAGVEEIYWDGTIDSEFVINVHDLYPGKIAIKASDEVLSYDQFNGSIFEFVDGPIMEVRENELYTGYPGVIYWNDYVMSVLTEISINSGTIPTGTYFLEYNGSDSYMARILKKSATVKPIDKKFIPYLVGENTEGVKYNINGTEVTAAVGAEIFNDYINNKATGEHSHAEGSYTTASSWRSHAEGYSTTASGSSSHAEGMYTTASGNCSHAEGERSTASSYYSHAEGYKTQAIGQGSHAEGTDSIASGNYSHAEGNATTASGYSSHAEGINTNAAKSYSHAEGYGTIANGECQHVQGKFNTTYKANSYAHIVGNGTSNSIRSNAHTLDWNGNAWFAGNVYIGGASDDTATDRLASTTYVDNKVADLVNSAPGTLDTLNELAAALGNDENFATTVTNSLAEKASKTELETHTNNKNNPHSVTLEQLGYTVATDEDILAMLDEIGLGEEESDDYYDTITDEQGNTLADEQGNELAIESDMEVLTDEQGNTLADEQGNELAIESVTVINGALMDNQNNTLLDKNGNVLIIK